MTHLSFTVKYYLGYTTTSRRTPSCCSRGQISPGCRGKFGLEVQEAAAALLEELELDDPVDDAGDVEAAGLEGTEPSATAGLVASLDATEAASDAALDPAEAVFEDECPERLSFL